MATPSEKSEGTGSLPVAHLAALSFPSKRQLRSLPKITTIRPIKTAAKRPLNNTSVAVSVMMQESTTAILFVNLLLRKRSPDLAGNRLFLTVYTDDKELSVRPNKSRWMPVKKLAQ